MKMLLKGATPKPTRHLEMMKPRKPAVMDHRAPVADSLEDSTLPTPGTSQDAAMMVEANQEITRTPPSPR